MQFIPTYICRFYRPHDTPVYRCCPRPMYFIQQRSPRLMYLLYLCSRLQHLHYILMLDYSVLYISLKAFTIPTHRTAMLFTFHCLMLSHLHYTHVLHCYVIYTSLSHVISSLCPHTKLQCLLHLTTYSICPHNRLLCHLLLTTCTSSLYPHTGLPCFFTSHYLRLPHLHYILPPGFHITSSLSLSSDGIAYIPLMFLLHYISYVVYIPLTIILFLPCRIYNQASLGK